MLYTKKKITTVCLSTPHKMSIQKEFRRKKVKFTVFNSRWLLWMEWWMGAIYRQISRCICENRCFISLYTFFHLILSMKPDYHIYFLSVAFPQHDRMVASLLIARRIVKWGVCEGQNKNTRYRKRDSQGWFWRWDYFIWWHLLPDWFSW